MTGVTGFVGRHLARRLVEDGYEVFAIVRPRTGKAPLPASVKAVIDDGSIAQIMTEIQKYDFAGVVHLASLFLSRHRSQDIDQLIGSNILFGTRVLEAAVAADIKWFINTGTFWPRPNRPLNASPDITWRPQKSIL
jgi:nucleoside-diphosphate-sugar epimerase